MKEILSKDIDKNEWDKLVQSSSTGTWFQTPDAYVFYESVSELLKPFAIGIENPANTMSSKSERHVLLKGICIGYVTVQHNPILQFFTRRAIIYGGPLLTDDANEEDVTLLMQTVSRKLSSLPWKQRPIYIETRNFNDFSRYKEAFKTAGFSYIPHNNFHIHTTSEEQINQQLDENRRRNIRATIKAGATIVDNPSTEQVKAFYKILQNLYSRKVKTPLVPLIFFETLRKSPDSVFLLVEYKGKIIGGIACVFLKGRCMYEWYVCGEDGKYDGVYPSSYATYAGLQYAANHNIPLFDMMGAGVPGEPNGIRDFKARFGGQLVEHGRFIHIVHPLLYRIGKLGLKLLQLTKKQ